MHLSTRTKAFLALLLTGIIGGAAPLFTRVALREFNPSQVLFIRFGIATLLLAPFFIKHFKRIPLKMVMYLVPAGLLFSGNVFFFVVGIQYTTSIVSQLFYLLVPVIVSLLGYFLFREKISFRRIMSMIICFGGSFFLISRSLQGNSLIRSIGTFQGNALILCAVFSWSLYMIYVKRVGQKFKPLFFLIGNLIAALLVSCMGLFITRTSFISTITQFIHSDLLVMGSLIALAVVNSILFVFLYQWNLKHVSAFIVASTLYISPLATAFFAIPFFGEQLSMTLLISAASIFLGSYFILSEKK